MTKFNFNIPKALKAAATLTVALCAVFIVLLALTLNASADTTAPQSTEPGYLTFSSDLEFTLKTSNSSKNWNGTLYYSTDLSTWNEWNGKAINSSSEGKLYLRGTGNTKITGSNSIYRFVLNGTNISCNGNILTLLDHQTVLDGGEPSMSSYAFAYLFYNCSNLCSAPELPAETLSDYCYRYMFYNCSALSSAPELPAKTMSDYCYSYMFYGCTSLTTLPNLPATVLASSCYRNMFQGCTGIKISNAKIGHYTKEWIIPATSSASYWNSNMFDGTDGIFTENPEINKPYYLISADEAVADIEYLTFSSENTFTLHNYYSSKGWNGSVFYSTDLKNWFLWHGQTINSSENGKLYLCGIENNYISQSSYRFILSGTDISCSGNIMTLLDFQTVLSGEEPLLNSYAFSYLFAYNDQLISAPELPATTLATSCYESMFYGCTGLTTAPELPATTLESTCYQSMFYGCTGLTTAPELPATTLATSCYESMFYGCTGLTDLPSLPATTLPDYCYRSMFSGCSGIKLSNVKIGYYTKEWQISSTSLSNYNYYWNSQMFYGTGGIFTDDPELNKTYYIISYDDPAVDAEYLTFSSENAFSLQTENSRKNWDGTLIYSTDLLNWCLWDGRSTIKSSDSGKLYLCGCENTIISGSSSSYRFVLRGTNISCSGNIMTLLDFQAVKNGKEPEMGIYAFANLFSNNTQLISAPELTATTLSNRCYSYMFSGCSGLLAAPSLSSTDLAESCYSSMFSKCSSLTSAPELPAKTLANYCYYSMFYQCVGLKSVPELPATTLTSYCYTSMFYGCTGLETIPELPATTLADYCYQNMFYGCTGINISNAKIGHFTKEWKIPATEAATNWNSNMFTGTGGIFTGNPEINKPYYLISADEAVADIEYLTFSSENAFTLQVYTNKKGWDGILWYSTDLSDWTVWDGQSISSSETGKLYLCGIENETITNSNLRYRFILNGTDISCSGNIMTLLDFQLVMAGEEPAMKSGAFAYMFYNSKNLISAPTLPAKALTEKCYQNMFFGCTGLTATPALPATILSDYCYQSMFEGCTGLTAAPALPAMTLANYCYQNMFKGCIGLTKAPTLSATTLANYCYQSMFEGCTGLTAAPALPAMTLANYCYQNMFKGCASLKATPKLPATELADYCYYAMFYGCTSLTLLPELPATALKRYCYYNMFSGCTGIKLSSTKTGYEDVEWKIPESATYASNWNGNMFSNTGGTFTGSPSINKTYYIPTSDTLNVGSAYLTFSSDAPFTLATMNSRKNWNGTLYYSTDLATWNVWDGTSISSSSDGKLYLCGTGNTKISPYANSEFILTGTQIHCSGNIMTLLSFPDVLSGDEPTMESSAFSRLFYNNTQLCSAPDLPALNLSTSCYGSMFYGCSSLTSAPSLPATALTEYCYYYMFYGCTALVSPPEIHATTVAKFSCQDMFSGCTSLQSTPELHATVMADYCYYEMFYNCTGLTKAHELPATFLATSCYANMFRNCTSLTTAPDLPATTLQQYCYSSMFSGCTSLTMLPAIHATYLESDSCGSMFANCTGIKLSNAKIGHYTKEWKMPIAKYASSRWNFSMFYGTGGLFTNDPTPNTTYYIFDPDQPAAEVDYVTFSSESTFTISKSSKTWNGMLCYSTDLINWNKWNGETISSSEDGKLYLCGINNTRISYSFDTGIVITGTNISCSGNIMSLLDFSTVLEGMMPTMSDNAFDSFFKNNTQLISAPELPATVLSSDCYRYMFYGCTGLTKAPSLPATTLASGCYDSMFYGCTGLTEAPELPATTLASSCYEYMFYNCTSLKTPPKLPATVLGTYCYSSMFARCTALTKTPELPAVELANYCYKSMFEGCTALTSLPELPATKLAPNCYSNMFAYCSEIKLSKSKIGYYTKEWKIPATSYASNWNSSMFYGTGGIFTDSPALNTSYYTFEPNEPSAEIEYITFSSESEFTLSTSNKSKGWNGIIYYSTDLLSWNVWNGQVINSSSNGKLYLCGANNTKITGSNRNYRFVLNGTSISCSGNIMALLDFTTVLNDEEPAMDPYAFAYMFENNSQLLSAPSLPATTLSNYCYQYMFNNCTGLTAIPTLPAISLSDYCYQYMFYGCSSLKTVPELPAKDLAKYCYYSMFYNCIGLTNAVAIQAETLADHCCERMFYGCTGLISAPSLPATELAAYCYSNMFYGCTGLQTAPELPATELTAYCYSNMFYGCTGLPTAPELPATVLAEYCYSNMFYGCTGLTSAPSAIPATTLAKKCCESMFYGCTGLQTAPELPATVLAEYCYSNMFNGCTGLTSIPTLPATNLADYCYSNMFCGCTGLKSIPNLTASTLEDYCYYAMFSGCTGLTTLPEIQATTLGKNCCAKMFSGCTGIKLSSVKIGHYTKEWKVSAPHKYNWSDDMFYETGGDFTGEPKAATSYYIYSPEDPVAEIPYLTFSSDSQFTLKVSQKGWENTIYYSTDLVNWTIWDGSLISSSADGKLYLCGDGNTKITGSNSSNYRFVFSDANISCTGNIMTLLDFTDVLNGEEPTMAKYAFAYLFYNASGLTSAPELPATKISSYCYQNMFYGCSSLKTAPSALPAEKLESYCYQNMFYGCSSLTTAPSILPAEKLESYCYQNMFYGCSSLKTAPEISATKVANYCCQNMFYGCSSLTTAPSVLPANALAEYCYQYMFYGCSSLTSAPELPATSLYSYCYQYMFYGCVNLEKAPELPATSLPKYCYDNMFNGCKSLTTIPTIPAVSLGSNSCSKMFYNCTGIKLSDTRIGHYTIAWKLHASSPSSGWNTAMFFGTGGTFTDNPDYNKTYYIISSDGPIAEVEYLTFSSKSSFTLKTENSAKNWNGNLWYSTDLVAWNIWDGTQISSSSDGKLYLCGSYNTYITGSTNSNRQFVLSGTDISCSGNIMTLLDFPTILNGGEPQMNYSAFAYLFYNNEQLISAPSLTSYTLSGYCYAHMFDGCTGLTVLPQLPAKNLVNSCYSYMFNGCTGIKLSETITDDCSDIWIIPATSVQNSDCTWNMFAGTGGTFTGNPQVNTTYYVSDVEPQYTPIVDPAYLTFSSDAQFRISVTAKQWDGILYYSTDLLAWKVWNGGWISSSSDGKLYLRGINNTIISGSSIKGSFTLDGSNISCSGNIMTLLDYKVVSAGGEPIMKNYAFMRMFINCDQLISAPELPATKLSKFCYSYMFYCCTGLTAAPTLPALSLAENCYEYMFAGCNNLISAPELPATTLTAYCYRGMFNGCRSLTNAPKLPATVLADNCYEQMFHNCTNLETAPDLPATVLATKCYASMFQNCVALKNPPALPVTELADGCYQSMFEGCTGLTTAPELPATTLVNNCYNSMFYGCSGLTAAPALSATTLADYCYNNMFYGCSGLTAAPALPATTLAAYCYSNMFYGCSGLTAAPALPATTLTAYCYNGMFSGCSGLTEAPNLPATVLAHYCYASMFSDCTALTAPPMLPVTTLAVSCYSSMFKGCTGLTSAPELPATDLSSACYSGMFQGCTGLTSAPKLPATELDEYCYHNMFYGCTGLTSAPELPVTSLAYHCYSGMFYGCTGLTSAPELPATDLASYCYSNMFYGCTGLTSAPELPATSLAHYCYDSMFYGCTGLTSPPELPATDLASYCYSNMFYGCTSLTSAPALPATTLNSYCYQGMFDGCTSLTNAPDLPATSLAEGCYRYMFFRCESLTTIPDLPATTLSDYCYYSMFYGCSKVMLSTTKIGYYTKEWKIPATTERYSWNYDMFFLTGGEYTGSPSLNKSYYIMAPDEPMAEVDYITFSSGKEFTLSTSNNRISWSGTLWYSTDLLSWNLWKGTQISSSADGKLYLCGGNNKYITGSSYYPYSNNRFVLNGTDDISCSGNIMTLLDFNTVLNGGEPVMSSYAFSYLFYDNKLLISAPELPAMTLSNHCYEYMFYGCSGLTEAPALPATTLESSCYYNMFAYCTELTTLPELPATSLASYCYYKMFYGCSKIKIAETQTGYDDIEWKLPDAEYWSDWNYEMFAQTGGTFTSNPNVGTTYYIYFVPCTHSFTEEIVKSKYLAVPATCQSNALYFKSCPLCGNAGSETFEVEGFDTTNHIEGGTNDQLLSLNNGYHSTIWSCCGTVDEIDVLCTPASPDNDCTSSDLCACGFAVPGNLSHSLSVGYNKNSTVHTMICTVEGCDHVEDAQHVFDQKIVSEPYFKTPAKCDQYAVYYKSCLCGHIGSETFESYILDPNNHSGTFDGLESNNDGTHNVVWSCCKVIISSGFSCYPASPDSDCTTADACACGYMIPGNESHSLSIGADKDGNVHTMLCSVGGCDHQEEATHEFDQTIATDTYLKAPATCISKSVYYYSCGCGHKGNEIFDFGELDPNNHTGKNNEFVSLNNGYHSIVWSCCKSVYTRSVPCSPASPDLDCTTPDACVCTYLVLGNESHSMTLGYNKTDEVHALVCTSVGCLHEEDEPHNFDQEIAGPEHLKSPANCTDKAIYYRSCVCGHLSSETFEFGETDPDNHDFSSSNVCSRCLAVRVNEETFPDAAFRDWINSNASGDDGILLPSESRAIKKAELAGLNIRILIGIEYFTELEYLDISGNSIQSLDLSSLTSLTYLNLNFTAVIKLDLTFNIKLTKLYCSGTDLSSIKFAEGSEIEELDLSNNKLDTLDVSGLSYLTKLNGSNNKLTSVKLDGCENLTELDLSNNMLVDITINICIHLKVVKLNNNASLATLDLSGLPSLIYLDISFTLIIDINLTFNIELVELYVNNTGLKTIDLSKNTKLEKLELRNNEISDLDLSANTALTYIDCSNNALFTIKIDLCINITFLDLSNNHLTELILPDGFAATPENCKLSGQTREITMDSMTLSFDMTLIVKIVINVSIKSGGELNGNILKISPEASEVDYLYNTGVSAMELEVKLIILNPHEHDHSGEIVDLLYIKAEATCTSKMVYYKSCFCGSKGEDTFEYGEIAPDSHTGSNDKLVSQNNGKHNIVWSCCNIEITIDIDCVAISPDNDCTTADACDCGYMIPGNANHELILKADSNDSSHTMMCSDCAHEEDAPHNFNQTVTDELYLMSSATCVSKAQYFFSCECGHKGNETFEFGELAPDSHTGSNDKLVSQNNGKHNIVWSCCNIEITIDIDCVAISPDNDCTTADACDCGYMIPGNANHELILKADKNDSSHTMMCSGCAHEEDAPHNFNQTVADELYLMSSATCVSKAQYFFSCECGHKGNETFEFGELAPDSHTGSNDKLVSQNNGKHNIVWSCCNAIATADIPCTPMSPDSDCTTSDKCTCGYDIPGKDHTSGTATCLKCAICSICGMSYGEKDPNAHEKTTFTYSPNADGLGHTKLYECCSAVFDQNEAHDFGSDNKCKFCGYEKRDETNVTTTDDSGSYDTPSSAVSSDSTDRTDDQRPAGNKLPIVIIVVICAVIALSGVVIALIIIKKKK